MSHLLDATLSIRERKQKTEEIIGSKGISDSLLSEQIVIGAVLAGYANFADVDVDWHQFSLEKHRSIWRNLGELDAKGLPTDTSHLGKHLHEKQQLAAVDGLSYLAELSTGAPQVVALDHFIETIVERGNAHKLISQILDQVDNLIVGGGLEEARTGITKLLSEQDVTKHNSHSYGMQDAWQIVPTAEALTSMFAKQPEGIMTGIKALDDATFGLQRKELVIIGARPSDGKCLPNYTPVKTLGGWTEMGSLKVGDQLASIDGEPSEVVGVYPQGVKPMNRITFSDGRSTLCCDEHLWSVYYRHWPENRVLDTAKLKQMLTRKRYQTRLSIPVVSGDFGSTEKPLPLRPWLLGYLLGNGGLTSISSTSGTARVSVPDQDTVDRLLNELAFYGCGLEKLNNKNNIDYKVIVEDSPVLYGARKPNNILAAIIRTLGLHSHGSYDKFVPKVYLDAPRHTRIELIRGLMDSDGTADKKGSPYFCTTSQQLALDFQYLIRSIGGICSIREKVSHYTHNGEYKEGALAYDLGFAIPDASEVFWLERKKSRTRPRQRTRRLYIKSIEPCGEDDATCIAVSHPSKLYIANDFIVTHNTALMTQICRHAAGKNYRTHLISLEMSKEQLVKRICCQRANISYHRNRIGETSPEENAILEAQFIETANTPLKISDGVEWTIQRIKNHLKYQRSIDEPVDLLAIDYLGLMPITGHNKRERRDLDLGEITRGLKLLAKEFDCVVILLSQLNRDGEKQNRKPIKSDLKDSGNIEADADMIMMLWHDRSKEQDWGRPAEILLEKQRNGPTGPMPVYFMRESTSFVDRN